MSRGTNESSDNNYKQELITLRCPISAMGEAYRTLRANLGFSGMKQPFRSIMVTSTSEGDGKSTVVSNLAVVMAQAAYKVILVDCNLRKPSQHKIFNLNNHRGFIDCILQRLEADYVANKVMDNLTVLTSGLIPPNPAEMLNSQRTRDFWNILLEKYDYVLIDSSPMMVVADATVLSNQVDGVILVVNSGTSIDLGLQAKEQLTRANARIIGVVLNQVKMNSDHYYDYY
ncbi:MAG TPA: CpsD/CapB family tyrosine-protein kinase [Syntrophomonadaceae bacterium]|nr:CpsD/CapB family tyrosine-protein kinase [Syntrophomonadaceae bacterium]